MKGRSETLVQDPSTYFSSPIRNMNTSRGDIPSNSGEHRVKEFEFNQIFQRDSIYSQIKNILENYDEYCKNINFKKGIYIYGATGCGKTEFINHLLKENNFDVIKYDAGDIRNKTLIETITSNNISNKNILDMMKHQVKRIVIIMDEIDGMNNGDKGGITSLIKLIRQKKTKKQKSEAVTLNPIICIGNYFMDKKIRELMKVCNVFELKKPTDEQINTLLDKYEPRMPFISDSRTKDNIIRYIQGDLRKFNFITRILKGFLEKENFGGSSSDTGEQSGVFAEASKACGGKPREHEGQSPECSLEAFQHILSNIFKSKIHIEDSKRITQKLMESNVPIEQHNTFMNETDRTIVALLWHENIVDKIGNIPISHSIPFYVNILDNMCYSDYIDRITFQNQIWQFNEMSSMMKTFYNNKLFNDYFPQKGEREIPHSEEWKEHSHSAAVGQDANSHLDEIRFTKVLTKYSTEYNNQLFIYNICQELDMDKKDVIALFHELRILYGHDFLNRSDIVTKVDEMIENYNINKLDIKRIYRYLDKNVKKDIIDEEELFD